MAERKKRLIKKKIWLTFFVEKLIQIHTGKEISTVISEGNC